MAHRIWLVGAAAIGALAACTPVDPRTADRAEDECRSEARAEGYRAIEVTGQPTGLGDNVVLSMRAERNGREYSGSCTFDRSSRRVKVDLERRDGNESGLASRASEACRVEARDRGYDVRRVGDIRAIGDTVRVSMDLRRRGKNFEGYCRFEGSRADLEVQG